MTTSSAAATLRQARTVVIKLGSSLLVDEQHARFNRAWFDSLIADVADLKKTNKNVILVSSGAIALGCLNTGISRSNLRLAQSQAMASMGQITLAHEFDVALRRHQLTAGQILLTLDDTEQRKRYLNARNALHTLFEMNVVPVINENDTVATSEIRYGDNDRLAARVAQMMSADCLVLLSDVDGLYERDPRECSDATLVERVEAISATVQQMAGGTGSAYGTGGMQTKIDAAELAVGSGCHMILASGLHDMPLRRILDDCTCTHFVADGSPGSKRKQWIAGSLKLCGSLTVDDGAGVALTQGSSLLPVGVIALEGTFERGDAVLIKSAQGATLGKGLCAYSSVEVEKIAGCRSNQLEALLGYLGPRVVIHRDDLVFSQSGNEDKSNV